MEQGVEDFQDYGELVLKKFAACGEIRAGKCWL